MRPTLYIVRGLPGSGKSTLARKMLAQMTETDYFEADMYFEVDGKYVFTPAKLSSAHSWCIAAAAKSLSEGRNVIVANTFTTVKEITPYLKAAKRVNADVRITTCDGEWDSVHNVPEKTLERMKARFVSGKDIRDALCVDRDEDDV